MTEVIPTQVPDKKKSISRRGFLKIAGLVLTTPAFSKVEKLLEPPKYNIMPERHKYFPTRLKSPANILSGEKEENAIYTGLTLRVRPEENRTLSDEASKTLGKVRLIFRSDGRPDKEVILGEDSIYTYREENYPWFEGDKVLLQPSNINWGNPQTFHKLNRIEGKDTLQISTTLHRKQGTAPRPEKLENA